MSAIAANVFSGLMKAITPAIRNSTANSHMTTRSQPPASDPNTNCWNAGQDEHQPDQHAHRGDRGLVELQDHQGDHYPGDAGYQPEPPELADWPSGSLECGPPCRRSSRKNMGLARRVESCRASAAATTSRPQTQASAPARPSASASSPIDRRPGEQAGVADARDRRHSRAGDRRVVAGRPHGEREHRRQADAHHGEAGDRAGGRGRAAAPRPGPPPRSARPLGRASPTRPAPPRRRPTAARNPSRG